MTCHNRYVKIAQQEYIDINSEPKKPKTILRLEPGSLGWNLVAQVYVTIMATNAAIKYTLGSIPSIPKKLQRKFCSM